MIEQINFQISISEIVQIMLMVSYVIITGIILYVSSKQTTETFCPKIYADFRFKGQSMSFVIKNVGGRAAYDIKIAFNPAFKYKMPDEIDLNNHPLLNKLSFLSPKEEAETSIGTAVNVLNMQQTENLSIEITYFDEKRKKFLQKYNLNIDSYRRNYVDHKDISHIARDIEKIEKHIKVIAKSPSQQT